MKRRHLTCLSLAILLIGGCAGEIQKDSQVPQATETPTAEINTEVHPGIHMSNDPADFPFPISGYDVYFVGETHGNPQTKQVFQAYLERVYKEAGVRDVILEEDQVYETEANAYVQGSTDVFPHNLCLRADILGQIREFNSKLPDDEKVIVHLVDVDSPLPIVYKHLVELHSKLGPAGETITIPDLSEFETWSPGQLYDLIDELRNASASQPDILNGLDTVYLSLRWYFLAPL